MSNSVKIAIITTALATIFLFYWLFLRSSHIDAEESDLRMVLDTIYQEEKTYYSEHGYFTADSGPFERIRVERNTIVGFFPECKTGASAVFHFFGHRNKPFETHVKKVIEEDIVKNQCRHLKEQFTAFAAQNLDEDYDFELWSIDESNTTKILLSD